MVGFLERVCLGGMLLGDVGEEVGVWWWCKVVEDRVCLVVVVKEYERKLWRFFEGRKNR